MEHVKRPRRSKRLVVLIPLLVIAVGVTAYLLVMAARGDRTGQLERNQPTQAPSSRAA